VYSKSEHTNFCLLFDVIIRMNSFSTVDISEKRMKMLTSGV
jgi:hypothetical protein